MENKENYEWYCEQRCKNAALCQKCSPICKGQFKKAFDLETSGLTVYRYINENFSDETGKQKLRRRMRQTTGELFFIQNATEKTVPKAEFMLDLDKVTTQCSQCSDLLTEVRTIMQRLNDVKKNQIVTACDRCKLFKSHCKQCAHNINKFLVKRAKHYEEKHKHYKNWVGDVKKLVTTILEHESISKIHDEPVHEELRNIIGELRKPKTFHEPEIKDFPAADIEAMHKSDKEGIVKNQALIDKIIAILQSDKPVAMRDEAVAIRDELQRLLGEKDLKKIPVEILICMGKLTSDKLTKLLGSDLTNKFINQLLGNIGKLSLEKVNKVLGDDIKKEMVESLLIDLDKLSKNKCDQLFGLEVTRDLLDRIFAQAGDSLNKDKIERIFGPGVSNDIVDQILKNITDSRLTITRLEKIIGGGGGDILHRLCNRALTYIGKLTKDKLDKIVGHENAAVMINTLFNKIGRLNQEKCSRLFGSPLTYRIVEKTLSNFGEQLKRDSLETIVGTETAEEILNTIMSTLGKENLTRAYLEKLLGPSLAREVLNKMLNKIQNLRLTKEKLLDLIGRHLPKSTLDSIIKAFEEGNLSVKTLDHLLGPELAAAVLDKMLHNLKNIDEPTKRSMLRGERKKTAKDIRKSDLDDMSFSLLPREESEEKDLKPRNVVFGDARAPKPAKQEKVEPEEEKKIVEAKPVQEAKEVKPPKEHLVEEQIREKKPKYKPLPPEKPKKAPPPPPPPPSTKLPPKKQTLQPEQLKTKEEKGISAEKETKVSIIKETSEKELTLPEEKITSKIKPSDSRIHHEVAPVVSERYVVDVEKGKEDLIDITGMMQEEAVQKKPTIGRTEEIPFKKLKKVKIDQKVVKDEKESIVEEQKKKKKSKKKIDQKVVKDEKESNVEDQKKKKKSKQKIDQKMVKDEERDEEESIVEEQKKKEKSKQEKPTPKVLKMTPSTKLLLTLIKSKEKEKNEREKEKIKLEKLKEKQEKFMQDMLHKFKLPTIRHIKKKIYVDNDEVEVDGVCLPNTEVSEEKIKGTKIVPFDLIDRNKTKKKAMPLLFNTILECPSPLEDHNTDVDKAIALLEKAPSKKWQLINLEEEQEGKGIARYRLSDPECIAKGWTQLPSTKTMRRLNIYKMEPASGASDWFKKRKLQGVIFYDSGEKLAEVDPDGHGRWYYKSGNIALEYYKAEEPGVDSRYVLYSSGEKDENCNPRLLTVLGCFDTQGNGIVFDHCGNERLKYNQSEGEVYDEKIGPPGKWLWHGLNEPPELQSVFLDNYSGARSYKVDPELKVIQDTLKEGEDDEQVATLESGILGHGDPRKASYDAMLRIELENYMRQRKEKLRQTFKPYEIKQKYLKINEQFSLKIINQSNITLEFHEGSNVMKQNIGMVLINTVICDSETVQIGIVATPFDRIIPKSSSMENLSVIVNVTKRKCKKLELKHHCLMHRRHTC